LFYVSHEDVFHLKNTKSFAPDMHRHAARASRAAAGQPHAWPPRRCEPAQGSNHGPAASRHTPGPEPIRTGRHQNVCQADSKCESGLGDFAFGPKSSAFCPKTFCFCSPPKYANSGRAGRNQEAQFCRHSMTKNTTRATYAKK